MEAWWQDLRYGCRMLGKSPGPTVIALVTLAIGIGANTIMFGVSDMLMLVHPRKVKNPEQLAFCAIQSDRFSWFRYSEYLTLRDSRLAFSDVMAQEASMGWHSTLVHGDSVWHVGATYVSANYFSVLGVPAARGRAFLPEEERPGSAPVVVLSHLCWQRIGGDPKLVGDFVSINGTRCQVVGVAPEGFTGVTINGPALWLPLGSYQTVAHFGRRAKGKVDGENPKVYVVGRLKPNLILPVAQAQLESLFPSFKPEYLQANPSPKPSIDLRPPGLNVIEGDYEETRLIMTIFSLVLVAGPAIILVIGCLNLANMLIAQGASRHREIAIRLALGGG